MIVAAAESLKTSLLDKPIFPRHHTSWCGIVPKHLRNTCKAKWSFGTFQASTLACRQEIVTGDILLLTGREP